MMRIKRMDEYWRFRIDVAFELYIKRERKKARNQSKDDDESEVKNSFRSCACIDASINEITWTKVGVCVRAYKREH